MRMRLRQRVRNNSELAWRYLFNAGPSLSWRKSREPLSEEQRRLVTSLHTRGVATTGFGTLFGGTELLDDLAAEAEADASAIRDEPGEKSFLTYVLGETPPLTPESPY